MDNVECLVQIATNVKVFVCWGMVVRQPRQSRHSAGLNKDIVYKSYSKLPLKTFAETEADGITGAEGRVKVAPQCHKCTFCRQPKSHYASAIHSTEIRMPAGKAKT